MVVENRHLTTLTAEYIIQNHMVYHEFESSNLTITVKLLSHVKQAHLRYFNDQKEHSMLRVQSGRDVKIKQINDVNRNIRQLQDTTKSLKTSADEYAFESEEKSTIAEIKDLISKSNTLKHAATEK